jgi:hypothetical protein
VNAIAERGRRINSPETPEFAVFGEQFAAADRHRQSASRGAARGSLTFARCSTRDFLATTGFGMANYSSRGTSNDLARSWNFVPTLPVFSESGTKVGSN